MRTINKAGLDLIRDSEGLSLKAYPDPGTGGKPWTIGYGSTVPEVHPGDTITVEQANQRLVNDLARFERWVDANCGTCTDNQFAALVGFAFNLGTGNLEESTLLKYHLKGQHEMAAKEFGKWVRASGRILPGLVKRRAAEAALYLKG